MALAEDVTSAVMAATTAARLRAFIDAPRGKEPTGLGYTTDWGRSDRPLYLADMSGDAQPAEAPAAAPAVAPPEWASWADDKLLDLRIADLGVTIEGSALEARIAQLQHEI